VIGRSARGGTTGQQGAIAEFCHETLIELHFTYKRQNYGIRGVWHLREMYFEIRIPDKVGGG
jgi:hypothetical protein